jgi:hypothetical protein
VEFAFGEVENSKRIVSCVFVTQVLANWNQLVYELKQWEHFGLSVNGSMILHNPPSNELPNVIRTL